MNSSQSSVQEENASSAMQAPRRRKTTSNEDRERVVTAYENGATAATISEMFNLKKPTVHGIIKKYQTQWQIEAKKRGGNRSKLLSQQAVIDVRNWIDEDCTVTLKALAEKVFEQHGVRVSSTTIAREIKGFNYSLKMVKLLPERRNTPTTVEERKHYATQFYEIARGIPDNGLIYLDEVGFNVSMRTLKGRSQRGTPATITVPQLRTRNISIICAMHRYGVLLYTTHTRSVNRERFIQFIEELKQTLRSKNINSSYFIMDNVAFHKTPAVRVAIGNDSDKPLYLPPYSPFLNPIENLFSQWKNFVRRSNPSNEDQLMEAIRNGSRLITAQDCDGYISNMWQYMSRCLRGEEILD
ncbi:uncharacterized protein LOC118510467 isoform X1 [Anopheles stephensi]|uniref:uncharacterized protein LOC118510467 isoform X1 n=1 Tax=Anopheles stephensi TaxID=30069 RepID=UPI0016589BD1|nr:uncharacterized protein LOC118510467 isoform X1 [Anopheles stephensi]